MNLKKIFTKKQNVRVIDKKDVKNPTMIPKAEITRGYK